jgi:hypothetical protein
MRCDLEPLSCEDPLRELWDMVGPPGKTRGGLCPSPEQVADAAIQALKKRCVWEIEDCGKRIRIEAPTADELNRLRYPPGVYPMHPPKADDAVEVVTLTEAK